MIKYFYDTYAIIEQIKDNPAFIPYFEDSQGITSYYNALEIYYTILRLNGRKAAQQVLKILLPIVEDPRIEDIESSMIFRYRHKEKKLSYADCLGYAMAKRKKIQFLTGDKAFFLLPNVCFVK